MSWLNEWYRGTVTEDADGRYRGAGLGAALMKPFVDEQKIERGAQQSAVKRTIVGLGEDPSEYDLGPNATVSDATGAVTRTVRQRVADTKDKDRTNALTDQLKVLTQHQAPQVLKNLVLPMHVSFSKVIKTSNLHSSRVTSKCSWL